MIKFKNVNHLLSPFRIYSVNWRCTESRLISTLPSPRQHLCPKTCRTNNQKCLKKNNIKMLQIGGENSPGNSWHRWRGDNFSPERHWFYKKLITALLFVIIGILITWVCFPKHLSVINRYFFHNKFLNLQLNTNVLSE